jgi:sulfoquinovosyltransferase
MILFLDLKLSRAFASSDLFVMPSNTETLSFVTLESLASGVPVVGVAAGGLLDLIESDKTGYLVEDNDNMVEFNIKIRKLLADSGKRKLLGQNAVEWAQKWSWENSMSVFRNIQYQKAIKTHRILSEKPLSL